MNEGDVALASLPQATGASKARPVVLLRQLPPFGDWLVCGVSSQLHQLVAGFDETVVTTDADVVRSGLKTSSLIRLGFLAVLPMNEILGRLGDVGQKRHARLLNRLAEYLRPHKSPASP